MQTYDEMVDSGVGIVGKIPRSWSKSKLKYITKSMISGATPTSTDDTFWSYEEGTPWVNIADITDLKGVSSTKKLLTAKGIASKNMSIQPAGSIVFSIFASLGKMGRLEIDAVTNQAIVAITPNLNRVNDQYVFYYLSFIRDYLKYYASSNTQDNINETKLKSLDVILPSVEAQQRIADFLDTETAKIDDIIAKQERLLELLEEKRRATITHAVTRGLNPSVELKETNIPWLGKVPKNWKLVPIKSVAQINNGGDYKDIEVMDGGYPVIGSGGEFARASKYAYDGKSVLFGRKGTIDKPLYFEGKFWTVDTMFWSKIDEKKIAPKFLYFSALAIPYDFYQTKTALPSMTQSNLLNHQIVIPNLSEQQSIVDSLEAFENKTNELKQKIQTQIALLRERRTSLISHAVTGKVKV